MSGAVDDFGATRAAMGGNGLSSEVLLSSCFDRRRFRSGYSSSELSCLFVP
jgi:hypothetical protein